MSQALHMRHHQHLQAQVMANMKQIALGARSSAAPGAVVIGAGSIATGNIKGVAIGHTVLANGQDAVAIGSNSQSVTQGVALGRLANAGNSATALGNQATASGENQ